MIQGNDSTSEKIDLKYLSNSMSFDWFMAFWWGGCKYSYI